MPVETLGDWLRPVDIGDTPDTPPSLFEGGIQAGDVLQGALGDCWFLGAISALATRPEVLKTIFVDASSKEQQARCQKYGVYILKFYKWVEDDDHTDVYVVIDDRIPCNQLGKPLYARSGSEDEMWVMLLEKGYAKLHRNYENLKTGFVDYALRDLTGGNSQQIKWAPPETDDALATKSDEVWKDVSRYLDQGCLLGCSATVPKGARREVDVEGFGILKGHAYSLVAYEELTDLEGRAHRLLRLRNPWGQREWEGRWSDDADEWRMEVTSQDGGSCAALEEINRLLSKNREGQNESFEFGDDGTFWMTVEDFTRHYSTIYCLRDLPEGEWDGKLIEGEWKTDGDTPSAGGSPMHPTFLHNPQYMVKVSAPTTMMVLLEQPDLRMLYQGKIDPFSPDPAPPMFPEAIGLVVVKLEDEGDMEQGLSALKKEHIVGMTRAWCKQRDVSLEVGIGEAGCFAVIPCTYAAGVASKFRINLWTHTAHSGYEGERPEVRGDAKCVIRELGTTDLGYDSESPLSEDECEADEESVAAAKASADTLRDVSRELKKLAEVVQQQNDMLEEQRHLIDKLCQHTSATHLVAPQQPSAPATPVRGGAVSVGTPRADFESASSGLKELYYEYCAELGDRCPGPNEKVAVTLSSVPMENGAPSGTKLNLKEHLIGDKGMLALSRVLQSWPQVMAAPAGLLVLVGHLTPRCCQLTSLNLAGNGLRDEAALTLSVRRHHPRFVRSHCG